MANVDRELAPRLDSSGGGGARSGRRQGEAPPDGIDLLRETVFVIVLETPDDVLAAIGTCGGRALSYLLCYRPRSDRRTRLFLIELWS